MSNQAVGDVYHRVIQDVIETSLIDFEEAGVSVGTLEELRKVWQQKLSETHVAYFPWDPAPVQDSATIKKSSSSTPNPQIKKESPTLPYQQPQADGGPKIKTEPGLEPQGITAPPLGNANLNPQLAVMRAQQNIQQKFGGAAVPMLTGQQQQKANGTPKPPGGGLMLPGFGAPPVQHQNGQNGIPQVDGGDDYEVTGIRIDGYGYLTREQADQIILQKIQAGEKRTAELEEALRNLNLKKSQKGKGKQLDAYEATISNSSSYPYPSSSLSLPSFSVPQVDGPGSSDVDVDDDAINSDLDDPEDNDVDPDDDEDSPQIMLCMYDKVQRTKNKWKCVMKDGVLTINGKEYVFHKANGEYEW